jgi:hypothetical protein
MDGYFIRTARVAVSDVVMSRHEGDAARLWLLQLTAAGKTLTDVRLTCARAVDFARKCVNLRLGAPVSCDLLVGCRLVSIFILDLV